MIKLRVLTATVIVLLGLMVFGSPALAVTEIDTFNNNNDLQQIQVESDTYGNQIINGDSSWSDIRFEDSLKVYQYPLNNNPVEIGSITVVGKCSIDGYKFKVHTNNPEYEETPCYGVDILRQAVHFNVNYENDKLTTISD